MTSAIASRVKKLCGTRYGRTALLLAALAAAGVAQAQTTPAAGAAPAAPAAAPKSDGSLTWNGITFYGIIDLGIQYQTHGVPVSDYFPAGTEAIISKNSNGSITAMTPSNLSQSRLGLSGIEPLGGDLSAVFRLETFFNPQSGNLSDALKSITLNNGRPLNQQSTNVDSSVAGQLFAGAAYAGFSSKSLGTLTFGRHVTLLADGIGKYDPMGAAQAFSLIGFSGTTAGGGDTEDRRLDGSIKYLGPVEPDPLRGAVPDRRAARQRQQCRAGRPGRRHRRALGGRLLLQEEERDRRLGVKCRAGTGHHRRRLLPEQHGRGDRLGQRNLRVHGAVQLRRSEDLHRLRAHQVREPRQPDERRAPLRSVVTCWAWSITPPSTPRRSWRCSGPG